MTTSSRGVAARTVLVADARPVVAQGLAAALTGRCSLEAAAVSTEIELGTALRDSAPGLVLVPLGRDGEVPALLGCALRLAPAGTGVVVVGSPRLLVFPGGPWPCGGIRAVLPAGSSVARLAERVAAVAARSDVVPAPAPVDRAVVPERPAAGDERLASLTLREREVLGLLAQGRSTREMAEAMSVSVNTVRTHVNVLLHKLDVHSRLRAVALFADAARTPGRSTQR